MSRLLSVSLPDDLMDAIERQAEQHGVTRSEMVREALRREIERSRWGGLGDRRHLLPLESHRGMRVVATQALLAELPPTPGGPPAH